MFELSNYYVARNCDSIIVQDGGARHKGTEINSHGAASADEGNKLCCLTASSTRKGTNGLKAANSKPPGRS